MYKWYNCFFNDLAEISERAMLKILFAIWVVSRHLKVEGGRQESGKDTRLSDREHVVRLLRGQHKMNGEHQDVEAFKYVEGPVLSLKTIEGESEREKRGLEEEEGVVLDPRRGEKCTLPLFPCNRYSHNCCHGGSCRSAEHNQSEQNTDNCQIALLMCLYTINLNRTLIIAKLPSQNKPRCNLWGLRCRCHSRGFFQRWG